MGCRIPPIRWTIQETKRIEAGYAELKVELLAPLVRIPSVRMREMEGGRLSRTLHERSVSGAPREH